MKIVGIDMATQAKKTGLALVDYTKRELVQVRVGGEPTVADVVLQWLSDGPALLAIDAPLGWPAALGDELSRHVAGGPLSSPKNAMFRRFTDEWIRAQLGKMPLEVGADRIARTAHAALELLAALRETGVRVELAWDTVATDVAAIEVYPAATLLARGLVSSGYKSRGDHEKRSNIVDGLEAELGLDERDLLIANDDALDATLAALAGVDFLDGLCAPPPRDHEDLVRREGWIWVRSQTPL